MKKTAILSILLLLGSFIWIALPIAGGWDGSGGLPDEIVYINGSAAIVSLLIMGYAGSKMQQGLASKAEGSMIIFMNVLTILFLLSWLVFI